MNTPSFLDYPAILYTQISPANFDFFRNDVSFIEKSNAFFRSFLLIFIIIMIIMPSKVLFASMFMTSIFLVLYLQSELAKQKEARLQQLVQLPPPQEEGFMLLQPDPTEGDTKQYRKPTKNNPTGNFLPTDLLEHPNAIPAAPANNKQADAERMKLMEEAIIDMSPHNAKLMEEINSNPVNRKMFEKSLRPFLTNPVTAADTDMEGFYAFLAGPNYRTRKTGKETFVTQKPLYLD